MENNYTNVESVKNLKTSQANDEIAELELEKIEKENYHDEKIIKPIKERLDSTIKLQGKIDNFGVSVPFMEKCHSTLNFLNRSVGADIIANSALGNFVSFFKCRV